MKRNGFIVGKSTSVTKKTFDELQKESDIFWKRQLSRRKKDLITKYGKSEDTFLNDLKRVLNSEIILINKNNTDNDVAYELGAAWATNFILEIFRKNKMNDSVEMLNKYFVRKKKIIAINPNKKTNKKIYKLAMDQGKILKNMKEVKKL